MKLRSTFVSNSSSSSFIVSKEKLSPKQIERIHNHIEFALLKKWEDPQMCTLDDKWKITETETHISGETFMDNFDMNSFLHKIGVDPSGIQWGY